MECLDSSAQAPSAVLPFVSVVVRSYLRPQALLELVPRLLALDYPSFEVLVCEQSNDPELVRRLEAFRDPRLRMIVRPPLGVSGAKNESIRHARGEILLFIDNDDLPVYKDWIQRHIRNYADPLCQGVAGRLLDTPEEAEHPRLRKEVRRKVAHHTFWKDTTGYHWFAERKQGIDYLMGTNCSFRRSLCERIGGWDEGFVWGEEQSFAFKFARAKRPDEYFVHDPEPAIHRRVDLPGGANRRWGPDWYRRELSNRITYYHFSVGHYFPLRFWLLYPAYWIRIPYLMLEWIFDSDNRLKGWKALILATLHTLVYFPYAMVKGAFSYRRLGIRRIPRLWPPTLTS